MPLAGLVAAAPREAGDALLAEVAAELEPYAGGELESTIESFLTHAQRPI